MTRLSGFFKANDDIHAKILRLTNDDLSRVSYLSSELRYSSISKAVSSRYSGIYVYCQFDARVPEFDAVFGVHCTFAVYCTVYVQCAVHSYGGGGSRVTCWDSILNQTEYCKLKIQ